MLPIEATIFIGRHGQLKNPLNKKGGMDPQSNGKSNKNNGSRGTRARALFLF
jgi:hypothetical protein